MNEMLRRMVFTVAFFRYLGRKEEIDPQEEVILAQQREIGRLKLEHSRNARDLIEQFLVVLDSPDDEELRKQLIQGLRDLSDETARLEEFSR